MARNPEDIELPGADLLGRQAQNYEFVTTELPVRLYIDDHADSRSIDYNVKTGTRTLLKRQPVLGGYDPRNYQSERHLGHGQ